MIRWPWVRRAEEHEQEARAARERRDDVRQQWQVIRAMTGETREQHDMNGFNALVMEVVRGKRA